MSRAAGEFGEAAGRRAGERRKDVRKPFLAACKAAGIKTSRAAGICFHDLRHFAASRLVKVTDVVTAQKILGMDLFWFL